jgi:hypothetical protein
MTLEEPATARFYQLRERERGRRQLAERERNVRVGGIGGGGRELLSVAGDYPDTWIDTMGKECVYLVRIQASLPKGIAKRLTNRFCLDHHYRETCDHDEIVWIIELPLAPLFRFRGVECSFW